MSTAKELREQLNIEFTPPPPGSSLAEREMTLLMYCEDAIRASEAEIERLQAALRPFANMAKLFDEDPNDLPDTAPLAAYSIRDKTNRATIGDLRAARAALSGKGEASDG